MATADTAAADAFGSRLPGQVSGPGTADVLQFLMPKLADLLGLEAALEVVQYAPGGATGTVEDQAAIATYEGHCKMDVASIKVRGETAQ
jgi:hypothetical protein